MSSHGPVTNTTTQNHTAYSDSQDLSDLTNSYMNNVQSPESVTSRHGLTMNPPHSHTVPHHTVVRTPPHVKTSTTTITTYEEEEEEEEEQRREEDCVEEQGVVIPERKVYMFKMLLWASIGAMVIALLISLASRKPHMIPMYYQQP